MAAKSTLSNEEAVLSESEKKQFNGDAKPKEPFNLTEWLSHEVKLPQYCDLFLEQEFQSPSDCCKINETVLDLLGIDKIGHRKRILVSCQKLAARFGLSNQLASSTSKTSDDEIKAQQSLSQAINQIGDDNSRPALPPKKGKKSKPSPPRRTPLADESAEPLEQEVNKTSALPSDENSDISTANCPKLPDSTSLLGNESNPAYEDEKTSGDLPNKVENPTTYGSTPDLPSGSPGLSYEHLWESNEGEPQAASPKENTQEPGYFGGKPETGDLPASVVDVESTTESLLAPAEPPPIPPRADLHVDDTVANTVAPKPSDDDTDYECIWKPCSNNAGENAPNPQPKLIEEKPKGEQPTVKKRVPPRKPPRKSKPFSMLIQPGSAMDKNELNEKFSPIVRSSSDAFVAHRKRDEKEIFGLEEQVSLPDEKEPIVDQPQSVTDRDKDDNIYSNAEEIQKLPRGTLLSLDTAKPLLKKPIPSPRSKSLSEPEMKPRSFPVHVAENVPDDGVDDGGGSCTEDDLSGSEEDLDGQDENKEVESQYETVQMPPIAPSMHQPQLSKEGYLYKQGGQQNNKGWKRRWVVFDGKELCYYKDKEHTNESLQMIPVAIMEEVVIGTEDTKRAKFDLNCTGRKYIFALRPDDMDTIQKWAQILMVAIINFKKEKHTKGSIPGGTMSQPDKQGFLEKMGNNVVANFKKRYVAVKDGKFAYYHNVQDFFHASPINTLEMNLASVKVDPRSQTRFQLVTPHRMYLFQCADEQELHSWIAALEKAIQLALSDRTVINKIWENVHNRFCADCGGTDPFWASVNLVVCVCEHCIGVHRNLGVHTSKPRSLLMDEKIWKPSLIKLMVEIGNEVSNSFWKFKFPEDDQISPDCTSEERERFIRNKYVEKIYRHVSSLYGDSVALGKALRKVVVTDDVKQTMQLVFCGADVKYVDVDSTDTRTPYELAKDANQELQMEFLFQNGANNEAEPDSDNIYEDPDAVFLPTLSFSSAPVTYDKEGYLQKRSPSAAVWRKRHFRLKGRELFYDKGQEKDDQGVIKLKDVIEYVFNDTVTLDIVTKERTYNLRADTKEEALSWYTVLRNKQVFQIPLSCQELGSDGIPHLVAKCLQFMESHGMDVEGIYRKNGNKAKIKYLKRLFDQDAESVILQPDEYEVHDVAGLLKEYFRELPDPLMTEDVYAHFITASVKQDHNTKLYGYKESLNRLPKVNRNTLKVVIGHLKRVSLQSTKNLMKLENISLIFGPTLMSNNQTAGMDTNTINQEFTVIADFINFYKWLFDVGDDEEKKGQDIKDAIEKMKAIETSIKNSQQEVDKLTLDIYSVNRTQEGSRITVSSSSKACEICQEIVGKRGLAPDADWGLFQVVNNGEQERPFPATEKVLASLIETGKYSQISRESYLIVKENYVSRKMNSFGFQDDITLVAGNVLHTMKEAKRKDNWKKLFISLEKGFLSVYKNTKSKDFIDSWPVNETTLYVGVDKDKKPQTKFGFTIIQCGKDGQCIYRYICFDDEREQYRWISIFLKLKFPGKNIWVDPDLKPIAIYAEAMIPGRKPTPPKQHLQTSAYKLLGAVSTNVVNELRLKQKSFKK